ncbi:crosslink repair DNA glycosylase YcaQ family protein [Cellulomonas sp. NPDC089187]|uniref:DNA glycosylase AlkZ-like family protein n=1 Tax=Cellulomonas sp. NPDC089187 TaxID=3154970 RepID=UPI003447BF2E
MTTVTRAQALRFRARVQQLDRESVPDRALTDAAVLDLGVQATGQSAHTWALVNRGVPIHDDPAAWGGQLALAWTVRGAPHAYRRVDLPAVELATRPFSEADAGKRIFDANRPLKQAGIPAVEALTRVASLMRELVVDPLPKGDLSTALSSALPEPYLRWCRSCGARHTYEQPFRIAALHAGLELTPQTSPPVLRRVPDWDIDAPELNAPPVPDPWVPDARLDLVRAGVHLLGPTTPEHVAAYLDAPVRDVRGRWPADAVQVVVVDENAEASPAWVLSTDLDALEGAVEPGDSPVVRLVGPHDLMLQVRDRELLVPDPERRKELWPVLGRPGAVLVDGAPVGVWRPRATGKKLQVRTDAWGPWGRSVTARVRAQARLLARHRGLTLAE